MKTLLYRVKVTQQDAEDMVIELMQCNLLDITESAREELRMKAMSVRVNVVTHQ